MVPRSSYGTRRTASQVQPSLSWTTEGLSRQLEPGFSHAGHMTATKGAKREGPRLRHINGQHHASGESNGNGTPYAQGLSKAKVPQHQQPGMQAGAHVLLCYKAVSPTT